MFALAIIFLGIARNWWGLLIGLGTMHRNGNRVEQSGRWATPTIAQSLVAFNSIFQVLFFSIYAYVFITVLPRWLGIGGAIVHITMSQNRRRSIVYSRIPFVAGLTSWKVVAGAERKGVVHAALYS